MAYCLCAVARCAAPQLVAPLSQPLASARPTTGRVVEAQPLRKVLFELFASWSEDGGDANAYDKARGMHCTC